MKGRGVVKKRIKIIMIILLFLLPVTIYILYSSISNINFEDDNGSQEEEEMTKRITFEKIGYFDIEEDSEIHDMVVSEEIGWVVSKTGLYRYDLNTGELVNFNKSHGLSEDYLGFVTADDDVLYVGYWNGISIFDRSEGKWSNHINGTVMGDIRGWVSGIIIDSNYIWISAQGNWQYTMGQEPNGGISCYDRKRNTWTVYNSSNGYLIDDLINSIAKEGDKLWMGTTSGLYLFNISEKAIYIWDEEIHTWRIRTEEEKLRNPYWWHSVFPWQGVWHMDSTQENIILSSNTGYRVEIFNIQDNNWTFFESEGWIMEIEFDNDLIYLGTTDGVEIFNNSKNSWIAINESSRLLDKSVRGIEVFNDTLWIASKTHVNIYRISYELVPVNE